MTPQSLDEDFGRFLALFGSPVHAQPMPEAAFDACAGLLPRQLFIYWREVGVCGFGDGLMWMTNPQEFELLLARWLQGTLLRQRRDLAVIARTAASELLLHKSAFQKNNGQRVTLSGAMAKMYSSEVCVRVATEAIQIHGGYGYTKDFPVEKFFRDSKLCTIGEGTTEIQKLVITRQIDKNS